LASQTSAARSNAWCGRSGAAGVPIRLRASSCNAAIAAAFDLPLRSRERVTPSKSRKRHRATYAALPVRFSIEMLPCVPMASGGRAIVR
jgi:hypothetical protein